MNRLVTIFAALFMLADIVGNAQVVEFPMTFVNQTPTERKSFSYTFAAHPKATSGVDTSLGEREIPPFPPPAGVYFVYTVPPSVEYIWLSPKDVRQLREGVRFREDYDVHVLWTGGLLEVTWNSPLPPLIDSAYLTDAWSDFPDNFIKVKIEQGKSYTTDNPAITHMKVLVWYNGSTTSVSETSKNVVAIYPNPASEVVMMAGLEVGTRISLYDVHGAVVKSFVCDSETYRVDVAGLARGSYLARIDFPNGMCERKTFVRL